MVSNHELFTNKSTRYPMTLTQLKKPGARKSLCPFTKIIYVKNRTTIRRVGAPRSKQKTIKAGTTLWSKKTKQKVNLKINDQIKKSLYNLIIHHKKVLQSPIFNDFLTVNINSHTRPHFFLNLYCKCPSKKFITALLVTQNMVE